MASQPFVDTMLMVTVQTRQCPEPIPSCKCLHAHHAGSVLLTLTIFMCPVCVHMTHCVRFNGAVVQATCYVVLAVLGEEDVLVITVHGSGTRCSVPRTVVAQVSGNAPCQRTKPHSHVTTPQAIGHLQTSTAAQKGTTTRCGSERRWTANCPWRVRREQRPHRPLRGVCHVVLLLQVPGKLLVGCSARSCSHGWPCACREHILFLLQPPGQLLIRQVACQ
mmetsp:Transcript_73853/g.171304  ORF Transcript_73853/g.171304 Transcript_73853/m.171304 type:complete len:220 (-) Transcript_73853:174-833(-)